MRKLVTRLLDDRDYVILSKYNYFQFVPLHDYLKQFSGLDLEYK